MFFRRSAAFTLLEVLAVLALMGLVSALLIGSGQELLQAMTRDDPEQVALRAIASARHSAVLKGRTLELSYDEVSRMLNWEEGCVVLAGAEGVRLLPAVTVSAELIGGARRESALARVRFYADGTCDPFRLETTGRAGSRILAIDPWSCAVLAADGRAHAS